MLSETRSTKAWLWLQVDSLDARHLILMCRLDPVAYRGICNTTCIHKRKTQNGLQA
jgi:hypothetical protein